MAREVPDTGVGRTQVGPIGIVVLALVILAAMAVAIYALVVLWPEDTSPAAAPSHVLGLRLLLGREQRLFVIVALAGGLGGLIHSSRSLYTYTGNRILLRSWLLMYLSLPFVGSALAVIFYVVLRGGLVSGAAAQVNVFGFAAAAALVGLFSPEAVAKLKQVFGTMLAPAEQGRDRLAPRATTAPASAHVMEAAPVVEPAPVEDEAPAGGKAPVAGEGEPQAGTTEG